MIAVRNSPIDVSSVFALFNALSAVVLAWLACVEIASTRDDTLPISVVNDFWLSLTVLVKVFTLRVTATTSLDAFCAVALAALAVVCA